MKILFLAHRTPYPPNKGEKIRSYHLLTLLGQKHHVSTVYWVDQPKDLEYTNVVTGICRGKVVPVRLNKWLALFRAIASVLRGKSFSEGYFYAEKFRDQVNRILTSDRYDVVYLFSSVMAQYVRDRTDLLKIIDFVDVDSDKWRQMSGHNPFPLSRLCLVEHRRLARYELQIARDAHRTLFVSEAEARLFREMGAQGTVAVLPNGVEATVRRLSDQSGDDTHGSADDSSRPVRLLFVGTMNYLPNCDAVIYFVNDIFPLIQSHYPCATFDIAGRFPVRSVRKLSHVKGVTVLGEVKDVQKLLVQADVSVAPIRIARGVQNKVLEAMAVGVPVVATPQAVQGIELRHEEVLIGKTPKAFADQVIRLLSDAALRKGVMRRAWNRVAESYSWTKIGEQLEGLIKETVIERELMSFDVGAVRENTTLRALTLKSRGLPKVQ